MITPEELARMACNLHDAYIFDVKVGADVHKMFTDLKALIAEIERLQSRNQWLSDELDICRSKLEALGD